MFQSQYSPRRWFSFAVVALFAGALIVASSTSPQAADNGAKGKPEKLLRHVVMFKFKDASSESDVAKIVDAFKALPSKIPEIRAFEYGLNNSPEGKNDGLTHCFLLTFHSEKDREIYLPHPEHKAFGKVVGPHVEKVTVVDYWTTE
ncbi:MAG: Dabb family protein [Aureliella sp.]